MKKLVSVVMGSDSDYPVVENTLKLLDEFGIGYEVFILSAHRSPDLVRNYARSVLGRGIKVIIAAAGGAAHLAGVIAAQTPLPVIGIPIETKGLKGLDSLLSIVQMPAGVPVATVAIGVAGAKNAAILSAQIISINNKDIYKKVVNYKKGLIRGVKRKNLTLKNKQGKVII